MAGLIGKPHGLRGEVYVVPISDDPQRFASGSHLTLEDGRSVTIASSRPHGDRFLVTFEGLEDRDSATSIAGPLYVDRSEVRDLEENEFWPADLIGLAVCDTSGTEVGTVADVRPGSAQDLLVVATDNGEVLVPMVAEIVTEVNGSKGITIDPPEGLL